MSLSKDLASIAAIHPHIAASLQDAGLLDRAFRCLESIGFALSEMDITPQDEFSHDVCFPIPGTTKFLTLGVT